MSNSKRCTFAIEASQNSAIAARPWCPLPSGSKPDTPTGSSTTAAGSNKANQSSLRPSLPACIDRHAATRAGACSVSGSQHTVTPMSGLHSFELGRLEPVDDLVCELLDGILLLFHRCVEPETVEHPRHSDRVGDTDVGLSAVAVQTETVRTDRLNLERRPARARSGTQPVHFHDGVLQLVERHHRRGPTVTDPCGATQRRSAVPADVERHPLLRSRTHLQPAEVEEFAMVFTHAAVEDAPQHLDRFVDPLAASRVRHATPLELLGQPPPADPETESVTGHRRHRTDLPGEKHRMSRTEFEYGSVETDAARGRCHRRRR